MRVIGGRFRSRTLKTLRGLSLRPTTDRLRETLFDILGSETCGTVFVDLYAGSGAVGIEALSRGASRAVFVEKHSAAVRILRENLRNLGLEHDTEILALSVRSALNRVSGDIFFLDPPYKMLHEYESTLTRLGQIPPQLVIAEHAIRTQLRRSYGQLNLVRQLVQGDNCLSFYRR